MSHLSVSVVVPSYNSAATLASAIKAIINQDFKTLEIIIVDDGSVDQTREVVQSFSNVRYVYQDNAGPAAARNTGAKEAAGDLIFFTDADCVPRPDWLSQSIEHFKDENIAVVAGSYGIANPKNILARCIHHEILYRHHHLMPIHPKAFGSYNFGIRKRIFEEVGGFEESYCQASGEDNDLSYKLIKMGHKIYFEKDSLVDHQHTTSIKKYLKEQYCHGFWRAKMYLQHPSMIKGDDYTFYKDALEVPFVVLIIFLALLSLYNPFFGLLSIVMMCVVFFLQTIFCLRILKSFFEVIFYNFVLFFRAFMRTFGLSSGICYFLSKILLKKVK